MLIVRTRVQRGMRRLVWLSHSQHNVEWEHRAGPGTLMLAPKGVPHTYRAESPHGGRFLTVTVHGDFERFVRGLGRPDGRPELPEPAGAPTPEAIEALTMAAAQHGIEIVGPPLS